MTPTTDKSTVSQARIETVMAREVERFTATHPRSLDLFARAQNCLVGGVPMQWMLEWPGGSPVFVATAQGARVTDVDGNTYVDFCLGDTGAMFGHSPKPVVEAVSRQAGRGFTTMMPSEDVIWVAEELSRRFGLPLWQMAMTATDANRFAIRLAREITGRPKILVFEGCYHGSVDETIATVVNGVMVERWGNVGKPCDLALTTRMVEFNDPAALEAALAHGDVACVLAEPALTNHAGIVLPDPGYHDQLREITRKAGTLLIIDETHTISAGPGGYTRAHGLDPDIFVLGKPLAGGVPVAVFGFTAELGAKVRDRIASPDLEIAGIGGTLTANPLSMAAMRANLEQVMTDAAYDHMIPLADRLADDLEEIIARHQLGWYVARIGARVEYRFQPDPPRNGTDAKKGRNPALDRLIHLYFLNRGILVTPVHNMLLISPDTNAEDVELHTAVFAECVGELTGSA